MIVKHMDVGDLGWVFVWHKLGLGAVPHDRVTWSDIWVLAREIMIKNIHKSYSGLRAPADPPPSRGRWPNLKNLVHTVAVEP